MSPLPSQEELRRLKAVQTAEQTRRDEWEIRELRGIEEARARYWKLLQDFVARAGELGIEPLTHEPSCRKRSTRIDWVEGFRLRGGSIVSAPPLRYCLRERRLVARPRKEVREVEEVALFVLSTDAGLSPSLGDPQTASQGVWPVLERWDRSANILNALEAELETTLLELMDKSAAHGRKSA